MSGGHHGAGRAGSSRADAARPGLSRAEFLRLASGVAAATASASALPALRRRAHADEADGADDAGERGSYRLLLATDIHYLSPRASRGADALGTSISSGALMTAYTDPIADALVAAVVAARPDAFVMPGDLTYDGERASHEDFAPKLRAIADAGIPVLVIPGNHDVAEADGAAEVDAADFADRYGDFGPGLPGTIARDDVSQSYVWAPSAGGDAGDGTLRLLMLDCNAVPSVGVVPDATLAWVEAQLANAQAAGAHVVAFSHQVLLGNDAGYFGLWMENAPRVQELYERYGVVANFSGHVHGQSVATAPSGLVDVTTAALPIYPLRYAQIDVSLSRRCLTYAARDLDVQGWARSTGSADVALRDFRTFSRAWYHDTQAATMRAMLAGLGADEGVAGQIADYFARVSTARQEGRGADVERRQDLIDAFADIAGDSTATRFLPALDPSVATRGTEVAISFREAREPRVARP